MSKKATAERTPEQVWLAGLGALVVAEQEGNDLFQQLVKKGREAAPVDYGKAFEKAGLGLQSLLRSFPQQVSIPHGARKTRSMSPETVRARQARRLESAQRAFVKEFGTLEAPLQDLGRLKQECRIFTVTYRDATYVPSFQFDERGCPRPAVAAVIRILGKKTSDWGLALWFTANDGWLGGRRPVDLLKDEPERVVEAAEHEAEELVF